MSECTECTSDPLTAELEQALHAAQRQERIEQQVAIEREQQADDRIVDALGARIRLTLS